MSEPTSATSSTPDTPTRRAVVVLGMHRSGTSVVAGCLQRLGIDFGPRLMPPNPDNPRGYVEHNDVVNLHDRLLLALDRSWDEPAPPPVGWAADAALLAPYREMLLALLRRDFAASPLWGLKDPRLCRLLPVWETFWPEVSTRPLFVLVRRAPAEVIASLNRRDGMSTAKASLLYLRHVLEAEHATRPHERLVLDFTDFLRDEDTALAPVRQALGLPSTVAASGPRLVDPSLGRATGEIADLELSPWLGATDAALRRGVAGDEAGMKAAFDDTAAQLQAAEPFLGRGSAAEGSDQQTQLAALRKQARWYEAEWQKALAKTNKLQRRLDQVGSAASEPPFVEVSKLENVSFMIKKGLSLMRKREGAGVAPQGRLQQIWRLIKGR